MEKYTRADNSKTDEQFGKNEIRVTTQGKMRRYISYATNLLNDTQAPVDHITLKAMGKAINKTVAIAEIIKRRIPGLHQITEIDSTDIKEKYNPVEEGLEVVETTRHVSSIQISLFTKEPDTSSVGYQPPIDPSEVKPPATRRTNPKGPRAEKPQPEEVPADAPTSGESYPPARTGRGGRGRGRRGRRGGARTGSYPPPENNYHGGYSQQSGYGAPRQQGGYPSNYQSGGYASNYQSGGQQGGYGGPGYHRGGRRGGRRGGYSTGRRQIINQPQ